jgi:hypothetical protein
MCRCGCSADITHYRYDLDHPDAPKQHDWDEGERRMRNIASNGGTGEHYDLTWIARNLNEWQPQYSHVYKSGNDLVFFKDPDCTPLTIDVYRLDQINAERQRLGIEPLHVPLEYEPQEVAFSSRSDGSTASYYQLPDGATELQHLISHRDMNAQIGEIFRAAYRYGQASHSDKLRDAKKIKFYIDAEIARLEAL